MIGIIPETERDTGSMESETEETETGIVAGNGKDWHVACSPPLICLVSTNSRASHLPATVPTFSNSFFGCAGIGTGTETGIETGIGSGAGRMMIVTEAGKSAETVMA